MECEERHLSKWILLTLTVGHLMWLSTAYAAPMEGEFVAGSFILTQKSLNEAPYREDDKRFEIPDMERISRDKCSLKSKLSNRLARLTNNRYAGVLRKALDKVETKDPPSKSDEENCSVRYRIRPSGECVGISFRNARAFACKKEIGEEITQAWKFDLKNDHVRSDYLQADAPS